jgi:hypothetical protein
LREISPEMPAHVREKAAQALAGLAERKPESEPVRSGPRGVRVADLFELARECGVEGAKPPAVTLDVVVAYAREHDLVLRPRRDGEQ